MDSLLDIPALCVTRGGAGQRHSVQQLTNVTAFRSKTRWVRSRELSRRQRWILLMRHLLAIILLFSQCSQGWQCLRSILFCSAVEATLLSLNCCWQRNTFVVSTRSEKNCCRRQRAGSAGKVQFQPESATAFLQALRKVVPRPYASVPRCQNESGIPAHQKLSDKTSS